MANTCDLWLGSYPLRLVGEMFPCAPWSAKAIGKLYFCVHKATFTSSSAGKWHVGMIIMASMMGGNLAVWILCECCTILDGVFWIEVIQVGLFWVGIFWVRIVQVGVNRGGVFRVGIVCVRVIQGGNFLGGNFPGGSYPGWEFSG